MAYAGKSGAPRAARSALNPRDRKESRPVGAAATGVAIGILIGAGLALLFAPWEGRDLRRAISRRARRARRRGQDAWLDLRAELRHAQRQLARVGQRGADAAVDALDDGPDV